MSMSMQEIFTRSVVHLTRQNAKSLMLQPLMPPSFGPIPFLNGERCAYRGVDGLKCVVGNLIPDELYVQHLEGKSVSTADLHTVLTNAGVVEAGDVPGKMTMLYDLQRVHDLSDVYDWASRLQGIAKKYNLIMPDTAAIDKLEEACSEFTPEITQQDKACCILTTTKEGVSA